VTCWPRPNWAGPLLSAYSAIRLRWLEPRLGRAIIRSECPEAPESDAGCTHALGRFLFLFCKNHSNNRQLYQNLPPSLSTLVDSRHAPAGSRACPFSRAAHGACRPCVVESVLRRLMISIILIVKATISSSIQLRHAALVTRTSAITVRAG